MRKITFLFFMVAFLLNSCSTQEDDKYIYDKESFEIYEEAVKEILYRISAGEIQPEGDLTRYLKEYESFERLEYVEGIPVAKFKGDYDLVMDFDGKCKIPESEIEIDYSQIENNLEIELAFGDEMMTKASNSKILSRVSNNRTPIPTSSKILLWNPLGIDNGVAEAISRIVATINNKSESINLTIQNHKGKEECFYDLSKFSEYDLVFIETHGDPYGRPVVPVGFGGDKELDGQSYALVGNEVCRILDENYISPKIPELDHTLIWTLMCYSGKSTSSLLKAVNKKNVLDYFGASDAINAQINLNYFYPYISNLYRGATSHDAFSINDEKKTYSIMSDGKVLTGQFGHWGTSSGTGFFPLQYVKEPVGQNPVVCFQVPKDELTKIIEGTSDCKFGIKVVNKETFETIEIELSASTIRNLEIKTYKDFVEGGKFTCQLDNLPDGTYEYFSYIDFGKSEEKKYSLQSKELFVGGETMEMYCNSFKCDPGIIYSSAEIEINSVSCEFLNSGKIVHLPINDHSIENGEQYINFSPDYFPEGENSSSACKITVTYRGELKTIGYQGICGGKVPGTVKNILSFSREIETISTKENSSLTWLQIPTDLESIISGCSESKLKTIDFTGCSQLKEIGGKYSFSNNHSLTSVVLYGKLGGIDEYSFWDCPSLAKLDLSGLTNLKIIKSYAFKGCGLKEIILPDGDYEIDYGAFLYYSDEKEKLQRVICQSVKVPRGTVPFKYNGNIAESYEKEGKNIIKIYVPTQSIQDYEEEWGIYSHTLSPNGKWYEYGSCYYNMDYYYRCSKNKDTGKYERNPSGNYITDGEEVVPYIPGNLYDIKCVNIFDINNLESHARSVNKKNLKSSSVRKVVK